MGMIAGGLGLAGSVMGLMKGAPADNVQRPPMFNMPYMDAAAGNAFSQNQAIGGMQNVAANELPTYQQITSNMLNNPYAGQYLGGAQGAANLGAGAAGNAYGLGNFLTQMGQGVYPYAGQIMQAGFDPQNALYDRTQHQLLEQTRAGQAARGLGMSPFGAGLENKAMSDFNIDWQNNLLQRMTQAGQGAGNLIGVGNQTIGQGVGMMGAAPGMLNSTSIMPYTAYNQISGDQFGALDRSAAAGAQAMVAPQQQFQNWLSYLGTGNQAGGVANNNFTGGLNQANLGFNQNQTMGANLGKSLSQMGNAWNSGGGSSGGGGSSFMPSSSFMNNSWGWG
jgi:hypothetical protein